MTHEELIERVGIAAENITIAAQWHYVLSQATFGYESIEEEAKSQGLAEALLIIKVALQDEK